MRVLARKRLRTVGRFVAWGAVVGLSVGLIIGAIDQRGLLFAGIRGALGGILIGLAVGVGEELFFPRWSRRASFAWLNGLRVAGYTLVMFLVLVLVNAADRAIALGIGPLDSLGDYATEGGLWRDLVIVFCASVLVTSLLQVRQLHNPGEIPRLLMGRYHYPREEARVFLFADLVGSTTIAERLGHLAYSSFLRDCFSDTAEAILAWRGQVYQYAGDAVIVSWPSSQGLRFAACVQCFFDMAHLLDRRQAEYEKRYGVAPRLQAGIHGGEVVTTWVGEARRDLAFHGDALNTTARLEQICRQFGASCLISEFVHDQMRLPPHLRARYVGETSLRGRSRALRLFAVEHIRVDRRSGPDFDLSARVT